MRFPIKTAITLGILGAMGAAGYQPAKDFLHERNKPKWVTSKVVSGDAVKSINTSGTVEPVLSVSIGSFVSGPIVELLVDYNDEVQEGELLAKVDPRLFRANVDRDEASLASREAEVARVTAQLQQARNNLGRGKKLRQRNRGYLSDKEMDTLTFTCQGLEAQLQLANASIRQAKAGLENSRANLAYCDVRSPVSGIVLKRLINPGQTLAAQFQAPELFVIAPDLRKKIHVLASVSEDDIGLIQKAQRENRSVSFTLPAYEGEVFHGEIEQLRLSSSEVQNVVTYPVVIAAENPDLKLLPGMTAFVTFEVETRTDVIKVPTAALRFFPENIEHVRKEDRELLDGSRWTSTEESDANDELSAKEKAEAEAKKNKRHVWVEDGEKLKAIEIVTGINDSRYTVVVSGELEEDTLVVTSQKK